MIQFFLTIALLLIQSFVSLKAATAPVHDNHKDVPVIHLKGTAYQRGFQHGSTLKPQIAEVYGKWKESIRRDTKKNPDEVIKHFLKTSKYIEMAHLWTPDILQEIRGLSAGSGQPFEDVFAFQLIDEYWGYLDRLENNSVKKSHCSAIGVAKNHQQPTIVAENIDIDNYLNGYQVLLRIEGNMSTADQYIMTSAGFLGFAGMNRNVAVVINALTDLNNSTSGLPVSFITRGILQHRNAKDALEFLKRVPHATGQNYVIGTPTKVYSFEASANKIEEYKPYNSNDLVYHTNHSLVNKDIKPWMKEKHERIISGTGRKGSSQTRLASLESQLNKNENNINQEVIKDILRSKEDAKYPICISYDEKATAFTFSSVIFTLGKNPYAEVTFGSPDQSEYKKFFFD